MLQLQIGLRQWTALVQTGPNLLHTLAVAFLTALSHRLGLLLLDSIGTEGVKGNCQILEAPPLQAVSQLLLHLPLVYNAVLPLVKGLCQGLHASTSTLSHVIHMSLWQLNAYYVT